MTRNIALRMKDHFKLALVHFKIALDRF
jgi:hypothetical protein